MDLNEFHKKSSDNELLKKFTEETHRILEKWNNQKKEPIKSAPSLTPKKPVKKATIKKAIIKKVATKKVIRKKPTK